MANVTHPLGCRWCPDTPYGCHTHQRDPAGWIWDSTAGEYVRECFGPPKCDDCAHIEKGDPIMDCHHPTCPLRNAQLPLNQS